MFIFAAVVATVGASMCAGGLDKTAKASVMGVIMIQCPHTGLAVSTGIETDDETFGALPDSLGLAICPKCGLKHTWWKREAWLESDLADPAS